MAGVELANAWVNIIPSTKEIAPGVRKALGAVDASAAKAGGSIGQKLSGAITKTLKVGAVSAGAAVGGVLAASVAKGMGRLNSLDQASAKLEALGNSGEQVQSIMDNALASVKGTAFGIGEAAGTAATMVASGVKPGQELESVLKGVADSAAIAGVGMDDMGLIWGKVAAKGKLDGETLAQMLERQIPIYDILAEKTGHASSEIADMVSKGKIDFQMFSDAMNDYVGGGAKRMGETVQGAVQNAAAAMGRFGAALTGPVFSAAPALISSFTDVFDKLTDAVKPSVEKVGALLTPALENVAGLVETRLAPAAGVAAEKVGEFAVKLAEAAVDPGLWERAGDVLSRVGETIQRLWPSVEALVSSLFAVGQSISVATWQTLASVLNALAPLIESVVVPLVQRVADIAAQNPGAVQSLVVGFLGFKAIGAVVGPVSKLSSTLKNVGGAVKFVSGSFKGASFAGGLANIMTTATSANPIIFSLGKAVFSLVKGLTVVSRAVSVFGNVFRVAMSATNPWVLVITAVVGALTWFFTQTETGQVIWQTFVDAVSVGWDWIMQKAQVAIDFLSGALTAVTTTVSAVFSQVWTVIQPVIAAIWTAIQQIGQIAINIFGGVLAVALGLAIVAWNAFSALFSAAWQGLIKPAIDAFGAAMTWLWQNVVLPVVGWIIAKWSELSAAMSAVWSAIKSVVIDAFAAAMTWLWQNVISPVIDWIVAKWNQLSAAMSAVWSAIKSVVIDAFSAAMTWLWQNVLSPVVGWIVDKWNWLSQAMFATWQWINSNVIERFKSGMQSLRSFFGTVVDGIRSVWNGLKSALAGPINFMINSVYNNGIARAWDTISGFLPLNPKTARRLSPISGYATGGAIRGEGTGTSDSILAWLSNGEHVWTAADVRAIGGQGALYAMREAITKREGFTFDGEKLAMLPRVNNRVGDLAGAAPGLFPAFKDGGEVRAMWQIQLERAHQWAKSRHGRPYVRGGSADGAGGTDCSGYMSGIANVIQGGKGARQWATMAFNGGGNTQAASGPQGFVAGLKANTLSIGVTNGGAAGGHTAGTLGAVGTYPAVNVESGGAAPSMVKYGVGAAGADHSYFRTHYHLPIGPDGAFVSGGNGSVSPEQMRKTISEKAGGIIKRILDPIRAQLPSAPPEWKEIPRGAFAKGAEAFPKAIDSVIDGLKDGLATVYHAIGNLPGNLLNGTIDLARLAGRAIGLHDQGGWLESGNLALNLSGKPEPVLTNSQWGLVAAGIRTIGKLIPALSTQADAISNQLIPVLEKMANPTSLEGIAGRSFVSRISGIAGNLGFEATSKVTSTLIASENALVEARAGHAQRLSDIAAKERALEKARNELDILQSDGGGLNYKDARRLADAEKALAEARQEAGSVTGDGTKAEGAKAASNKRVAKAEEKLARLREDLGVKEGENAAKHAEELVKANEAVVKAESDLTDARKKSAAALDMRIFDVAPQVTGVLSQAAAATSAVPAVSSALAGLAAAAGPAGMSVGVAITAVEQAISVAKVIIEVIDNIVGGIMRARVEVAKAFAASMDVIVELTGMIDKQRETVAGLRIDAAMTQIELQAAFRNVRITQLDGVRAQLESTKTLAQAQAVFDAQRQADMRAAAAQYQDLSLAYDRFRWAAKMGMDGVFDSMAVWSDETHALWADLQAARISQLLAEKTAQKANLEATYKHTLAVLNLQEVSTNLGYATEQLAVMSGKSFGHTSSSALIGSKVSDLYAEKAQLKAQQGQNWWRVFSWHLSGAAEATADRIKQIDVEIARLQARPEWEGFSAEQQKSIDKVMSKAVWAGFTGGGEYISTMIKNTALGDPQRALDDIKLNADLLALKKQQDELKAKIDKGTAEIDYRGKLDPLETEIKGLEMEKGSQQAWAEYWRAENAGVRDALAELARYQAESAKQVKAMADDAKAKQPITLVGSTAAMDDVQTLLEQLGHRVDRLEKPTPTAAAVAAARR